MWLYVVCKWSAYFILPRIALLLIGTLIFSCAEYAFNNLCQEWWRCNYCSSKFNHALKSPFTGICYIVLVHFYHRFLFWSNNYGGGRIERSSSDGTARQTIYSSIQRASGLALDTMNRLVYFVDQVSQLADVAVWPNIQVSSCSTCFNFDFECSFIKDVIPQWHAVTLSKYMHINS